MRKLRKLYLALPLILVPVLLAGCGLHHTVTIKDYLRDAGFNPDTKHQLLSLQSLHGEVGSINGSFSGGGFFFFGVSGRINGQVSPGSSVGFALKTGGDRVNVLEIPYKKVDFVLDESAKTPKIDFIYNYIVLYKDNVGDGGLWSDQPPESGAKADTVARMKTVSFAEMVTIDLKVVRITLTPELFSKEVSPLLAKMNG